MLNIIFTSTGQGYVLCRRFQKSGEEVDSVRYTENSLKPSFFALSIVQQQNFEQAYNMEFGK